MKKYPNHDTVFYVKPSAPGKSFGYRSVSPEGTVHIIGFRKRTPCFTLEDAQARVRKWATEAYCNYGGEFTTSS